MTLGVSLNSLSYSMEMELVISTWLLCLVKPFEIDLFLFLVLVKKGHMSLLCVYLILHSTVSRTEEIVSMKILTKR